MPAHYAVVPLVTVMTATVGAWIARSGMAWMRGLRTPPWTPSVRGVASVWAALYILAALSAILVLNGVGGRQRDMFAALFGVVAFLSVAWCYLFFDRRQIGSAAMDAALLALATVVLIGNAYSISLIAGLLLLPYMIWAALGAALSYAIFRLNP